MRGISYPIGRCQDAKANLKEHIQHHDYFGHTRMYGCTVGICGQLLHHLLYSYQRNGRRSGISSRQNKEGEKA